MSGPIPDNCLPTPAVIDALLRGPTLDADGRISEGGVLDGMTPAEVLADRDAYEQAGGKALLKRLRGDYDNTFLGSRTMNATMSRENLDIVWECVRKLSPIRAELSTEREKQENAIVDDAIRFLEYAAQYAERIIKDQATEAEPSLESFRHVCRRWAAAND